MKSISNHKIGKSKPDSLGSGKSSVLVSIFSEIVPFGLEIGLLPSLISFDIVINEKISINNIPSKSVAIGITHPSPVTVDIPAKATTNKVAPSNRIPFELLVILNSRTKVLMNLAHSRVHYDEFW